MSFRVLLKTTISQISSSPRSHPLTSLLILINPIGSVEDFPLHSVNSQYRITNKRWHTGDSHHGKGESDKVFKLGLAADIALACGKTLTGYLSGSTAIIADAAHSISDVVLSGVALWSFKIGRSPKDKEHPYGHGKFETLGALGISCMLMVTAGGIAWHALEAMQGLLISSPENLNSVFHGSGNNHGHGSHHHGLDMEHPVLALNMTIISICVKEGLYRITKNAGEKEGSGLMQANAWHHRADAVSSVIALIGVGGAMVGVRYLDPLAGIVVSGMILKSGIQSAYQSVMELVDAGAPSHVLAPIKQTILQVTGVKGCHHLRGRKAGSSLYLDVHIEVDPFLSVSFAHDIGESVRQEIQQLHSEVVEVFIHIDPALPHGSSIIPDQRKLKRLNIQNVCSAREDAERVVSEILSSKYQKIMEVEHITRHTLQGKVFLQVMVSMPPNISIRDAMEMARDAEIEILKASDINQVSIQLRLGHPIPQFFEECYDDNPHPKSDW